MFVNVPSLSIQRYLRANRGIMILSEDETYSVSTVTTPTLTFFALQWWTFALRSRYGHLRHGMDIAVMFGSFVVTPIRNIPVVHRTRLLHIKC